MAIPLPSKTKIHYAPPTHTCSRQCHLHWRRLGPRSPHRRHCSDPEVTVTGFAPVTPDEQTQFAGSSALSPIPICSRPLFWGPGLHRGGRARSKPCFVDRSTFDKAFAWKRPLCAHAIPFPSYFRARWRRTEVDDEARQQEYAHPNGSEEGTSKVIAGYGREREDHKRKEARIHRGRIARTYPRTYGVLAPSRGVVSVKCHGTAMLGRQQMKIPAALRAPSRGC